jgi:hypothetical protein
MKKSFYAQRVSGTAKYQLPMSMSREIGRIIVHWAYFEYCVQEMNWQTLGITPAAGRLAMREPRVENRLEMLHDLVKLRGGQWDDKLYKSILSRTRLIAAKRDLVAHGIWGSLDDGWYVELSRGSWPQNVKELVAGSRKLMPEMVHMDTDKLRAATNEIAKLIDDLKRLRASAVGPSAPSPGIHR